MIYILLSFRYQVRWYIAPIHIQKMVLFILQRGNKAFTLRAGGLFTASLQCFSTVKKNFYVLYSLHIFIVTTIEYYNLKDRR